MQPRKKYLLLAVALVLSPLARAEDEVKLPEITVTAAPVIVRSVDTLDSASLLADKPGISLYTNGGASSLPVIHGMNDDRVKVLVDGMSITSACANHMNPPLSYISASNVLSASVMAGLTPVSMGGDSIAGTISVASSAPVYAVNGEGLHKEGSLGAGYRSNGNGSSISAAASIANDKVSLGYAGSQDKSNSYQDGHGNLVRDTLYETRNHQLTFGVRNGADTLVIKAGKQSIPYQGFVNQYMDMVGNDTDYLNADIQGGYDWGKLDARLYWQDTRHEMGFFTSEKPGTMPMNTHGRDRGYDLHAELPLSQQSTLRIGNEYHSFRLDDWWPPVTGSMMMGPNTYQNINDGRRDRFSLFAEIESTLDAQWTTLVGVRNDRVKTDTGTVQSYGCGMMCGPDTAAAATFNALDRARSDSNMDLTVTAHYLPDTTRSYEFGFSRKTRSPNLYERYSWGDGQMAMDMIGWFGDGNGYVGNPDLKPEVANTLSATAKLNDAANRTWAITATPYYTEVKNYIGANQIGTFANGTSKLQFVNFDARIYGVDLSGRSALWDNDNGSGTIKGVLGWTRGKRQDDGASLYHIMPLSARISVEQAVQDWTNSVELQMVARKTHVDVSRNEPATAGYSLVNLHSVYEMQNVRVDLGVTNLFDRYYALPLGGVNIAEWKAGGNVGLPMAVAGAGRSINAGASIKF